VARSRGSCRVRYRLQHRHTVRTHISTIITIGPSLTGLRGTQLAGSIIYTLVRVYTQKYSAIASGATTIGSTERAPDDIIIKLFRIAGQRLSTLYLSLYSKKEFFDYSLGGYSHRERWACTRRCLSMNTRAKKVKEDSVNVITPIGSEVFIKSWLYNPNIW
jgi:hypothetical protein